MSLDQLAAVETIAEEGTVGGAARRLHISQPPLTRKLAALEDELGVRLFDRKPQGMTLTPVGEVFVGEAAAILAAVGRAASIGRRDPMEVGSKSQRGSLRTGAAAPRASGGDCLVGSHLGSLAYDATRPSTPAAPRASRRG